MQANLFADDFESELAAVNQAVIERVPGLAHDTDFLPQRWCQSLVAHIDQQPWDTSIQRRTQHYGRHYQASSGAESAPLPPWLLAVGRELVNRGHLNRLPASASVNEYRPGQGIAPHRDIGSARIGQILSITLTGCLAFRLVGDGRYRGHRHDLYLQPGSLLVMGGAAKDHYLHGISPRKYDIVAGRRQPRQRRIALIFRSRVAEANPSKS